MLGITILGHNSALPAFGRHPTAQVVTVGDELFLVDCGEGTQMRIALFKVRHSRITRIFISHLHGDHYFGLPGLINSMNLLGRKNELHVYGPGELQSVIQLHLSLAGTQLRFPLLFHTVPEEGGLLYESHTVAIFGFPVVHRIQCHGFRFNAKSVRRKLLADKARSLGIPNEYFSQLAKGHDYYDEAAGTTIANDAVTEAAPMPPSYAYCADTLYHPPISHFIQDVHTIYHESTFLEAEADKALSRYHSTAKQAALIALQASAQHLLLGHFSSRYETVQPFLDEAKPIFPNTSLTVEGATFLVRSIPAKPAS